MPKKKSVKKQAFLLLELMIGLALLVLVLVPFIEIPSKSLESELLVLQRIALNPFSERTCALVKERLYSHEIALPPKTKKQLVVDDTIFLPIKEFSKLSFSRKCFLTARQKKGKDGIDYFLVKLQIVFVGKSKVSATFTHKLFVETKNSMTDTSTPT